MKNHKLAIIAGMLISVLAAGCSRKPVSTSTLNGVTVDLLGVTFQNQGLQCVIPDVLITNQSGEDITGVYYRTTFYDKAGDVLDTVSMFWQADETELKNGESLKLKDSRYTVKFDSAASETVELYEVRTAKEYPLDRIPQPGEYLYQAMNDEKLAAIKEQKPVKIECGIDQSGYLRKATFTEDHLLDEAIDAFVKIKLGEDDAPMVTDNYNYFAFYWPDDTVSGVNLNLNALEVRVNGRYHSYYLENLSEFWSLIQDNLVEPPAEPEDVRVYERTSNIGVEAISFRNETGKPETEIRITNEDQKKDLQAITYELVYIDQDELTVGAKKITDEEGLPAGEEKELTVTADDTCADAVSLRIKILDVVFKGKDAPAALTPGDYLYQATGNEALANIGSKLPIMIEVYIDRMGFGDTYIITEEMMREAVDAFMKIKVGADGAPMITDSYHRITILFETGEEVNLNLNAGSLEYYAEGTSHRYYLEDAEAFWEVVARVS